MELILVNWIMHKFPNWNPKWGEEKCLGLPVLYPSSYLQIGTNLCFDINIYLFELLPWLDRLKWKRYFIHKKDFKRCMISEDRHRLHHLAGSCISNWLHHCWWAELSASKIFIYDIYISKLNLCTRIVRMIYWIL